jgi:outer membrane protein assembly factor BamA
VQCSGLPTDQNAQCNTVETIHSRVEFANAELRFPILRAMNSRLLPIGLPPLDGLMFYDAGLAWLQGQTVSHSQPSNYDFSKQRALLRSHGYVFRLNLFNIAFVQWDWAVPANRPNAGGFGTWFLGASY